MSQSGDGQLAELKTRANELSRLQVELTDLDKMATAKDDRANECLRRLGQAMAHMAAINIRLAAAARKK